MDYSILNLLHVIGAVLIGGGLIGVWMSDLRSRQVHDLRSLHEAVRNIAVFYDGVVVPGALLLIAIVVPNLMARLRARRTAPAALEPNA